MVTRLKWFLAGLLISVALGAAAAVFPYFGPVTGILKGNANDYHTTAAAGTDIAATFTGTCNSGTFLRGDGACASPGGGSVSSVNAAGTGIFAFTGGPITGSGTLTLTQTGTSGGVPYFSAAGTLSSSAALAANQLVLGGGAATTPATLGSLGTTTTLLHGNAAGAPTFGAVDLAADVGSSVLPVANGGTNLTASADDNVMVGNGTTWQTKAVPSCSGASDAVSYNTTTNAFGCNTISSSGVTQTVSTFTATFDNACTTSPTLLITYTLTGNVVTLNIPALTNCTSDSSSYTSNAGDMPVGIRPTSSPKVVGVSAGTDNGSAQASCVGVTSAGSLFFRPNGAAGCPGGSSWTSSGTKNANLNINNVTYSLD